MMTSPKKDQPWQKVRLMMIMTMMMIMVGDNVDDEHSRLPAPRRINRYEQKPWKWWSWWWWSWWSWWWWSSSWWWGSWWWWGGSCWWWWWSWPWSWSWWRRRRRWRWWWSWWSWSWWWQTLRRWNREIRYPRAILECFEAVPLVKRTMHGPHGADESYRSTYGSTSASEIHRRGVRASPVSMTAHINRAWRTRLISIIVRGICSENWTRAPASAWHGHNLNCSPKGAVFSEDPSVSWGTELTQTNAAIHESHANNNLAKNSFFLPHIVQPWRWLKEPKCSLALSCWCAVGSATRPCMWLMARPKVTGPKFLGPWSLTWKSQFIKAVCRRAKQICLTICAQVCPSSSPRMMPCKVWFAQARLPYCLRFWCAFLAFGAHRLKVDGQRAWNLARAWELMRSTSLSLQVVIWKWGWLQLLAVTNRALSLSCSMSAGAKMRSLQKRKEKKRKEKKSASATTTETDWSCKPRPWALVSGATMREKFMMKQAALPLPALTRRAASKRLPLLHAAVHCSVFTGLKGGSLRSCYSNVMAMCPQCIYIYNINMYTVYIHIYIYVCVYTHTHIYIYT